MSLIHAIGSRVAMSTSQNRPPSQSSAWHDQVAKLFEAAHALTGDPLQAFLERECDNAELRAEVERLLSAQAEAEREDFFPATTADNGPWASACVSESRPENSQPKDIKLPKNINQFRVIKFLGKGGFGVVYLAYDPDSRERVAVKVATPKAASDPEMFLQEWRTVMQLEHPHIVRVHNIMEGEGPYEGQYIEVSEYIDGGDLAALIKKRRPDFRDSARIIASIAEALFHGHQRKIYHRDIKPANILLDSDGKAYLTDFGIALTEADWGKARRHAGTVPYMSPEQANGEGHLVDGRSDVFSLGVVLYELLTGQRPFVGDHPTQILERVKRVMPRAPREFDFSIPKELERICLKALEKQRSGRYPIARDMAQDLQEFIDGREPPDPPVTPSVPGGLSPFESQHHEFFIRELLPGPREMNGLPQSIHFWKTRIEERNAVRTFRVGFLYGPSGCGKSSLIKAGLIPQLSDQVTPIYVEASEDETERRLLQLLRNECSGLPADLSLKESIAAVRHGFGPPEGPKVLLILDQFEQWLHGHRAEGDSELIDALRQCDGGNVQCLISVRADFWMAVARLAEQLDVELAKRENFAAVDLFDEAHAKKVLIAFGRAYKKLPLAPQPLNPSQESFAQRAVSELSEQSQVICVHLALFAHMLRGREWTNETLDGLGGSERVGVEFLKESFEDKSANPQHRLHRKLAQDVLETLLPESGTGIRGREKSEDELLEASGCRDRAAFQKVLHFLNEEHRLITPTEVTDTVRPEATVDGRFYQLTHDYLVPSIREWLAIEKPKTPRGRAELRLKQLTPIWNDKSQSRYLPSLPEFLRIQFLTDSKRWMPDERKMMRRARGFHVIRAMVAIVLLLSTIFVGSEFNGTIQADRRVSRVLGANVGSLENEINQLSRYRRWANKKLQDVVADVEEAPGRKLRASLALLPTDSTQLEYLYERLLDSSTDEFEVIARALANDRQRVIARLWELIHDESETRAQRFRAGLALASYAPKDNLWSAEDLELIVEQLVEAYIDKQVALRRCLRPLSSKLVDPLQVKFDDVTARDSIRTSAAAALADFAAKEPECLARLACRATPGQYEIVLSVLSNHLLRASVLETLDGQIKEIPAENADEQERVRVGQAAAGAAITLIRLGDRQGALKVFHVEDDPEGLTQFVARHKARGLTPADLLNCLNLATESKDVRARFGILLALGEFDREELTRAQQNELRTELAKWYATDPSAEVHSATERLLRKWGFEEDLTEVDYAALAWDETGQREWFMEQFFPAVPSIELVPSGGPVPAAVLVPGVEPMTFVALTGGKFTMGSDSAEAGHDKTSESIVTATITRPFAMLDREITVGEWKLFEQGKYRYHPQISPSDRHPVNSPDWYMAVEFCRWLTERAGMNERKQCYADPVTIPEAEMVTTDYGTFPKNWPFDPSRPGYRLPTEAEWEYACRGGTRTAFGFGNDRSLLPDYARFNSVEGPHPVGDHRPNLRGLFDMHGNALEWCHDWFELELTDGQVDPTGAESGESRILRGGGWRSNARSCRAADRSTAHQSFRNQLVGFRVVRTLGAIKSESESPSDSLTRSGPSGGRGP